MSRVPFMHFGNQPSLALVIARASAGLPVFRCLTCHFRVHDFVSTLFRIDVTQANID